MFLFIRLVLGHLFGDFPLQFNRVYELKHKGIKGGIPHAILIVCSLLLLSWPYLNIAQVWYFVFAVGILHLFQDSIKISYGSIKFSFWMYLIDQIIHIATISALFLTNLKYLGPLTNKGCPLLALYNNNAIVIYVCFLILATYNGFYLMRTFRTTFFGKSGLHNAVENWYGIAERAGIVTLCLRGGYFFLLLPVIFFLRFVVFYAGKDKFALNEQFISASELTLTWMIGGISGAGLYFLLPLL